MAVRPPGPQLTGEPSALEELALRAAAVAPTPTLLRQLGSSLHGLTEDDAAGRALRDGVAVDQADRVPGPRCGFIAMVGGPFVPLLVGLGVVFALLGDGRGAITIAAMLSLSVGLRVVVARRAARALAGLGATDVATVSVRRRATAVAASITREVPITDVVAGDVVEVSAGEVVPADLRLLSGQRIRVDQSVLSGETRPAVKDARPRPPAAHSRRRTVALLELPSMVFAGTTVVSGRATGLVLATGSRTVLGAAARAAGAPRAISSVDRGLRQVAGTFVRFMAVLVPLVAATSGLVSGQWPQAALFALAVAVGLTPELLPAIVTVGLARAASVLARSGLLVTRLDAFGDLGSMDVLCVDKTGTLTSDRVTVAHSIDVHGRLDETAVEYAFLVTHFQSGPAGPVDEAIADHVGAGADLLAAARYLLVEEIGFDHDRRRATVVLRGHNGEHLMVTRGAPDQVLACCTRVRRGATTELLTADVQALALDCAAGHERQGLRLVAVAARESVAQPCYEPDDERDLVLVGFVGLIDPLRDGVEDVVEQLAAQGVAVKVLTGDSPRVAARVAEQAGLDTSLVVVGRQVDAADDHALAALAVRGAVFAQLTPPHKARIVAALRSRGACVGVLGDGVNDTAALRAADVGVCLAGASPAARAAADLVLLRPDLATVAQGVVQGRRTLANTMKYVMLTAASNLGNVISVVAASVLLPFLPMLPIQLLVQNLLYDAAYLTLPFDRVDPGELAAPRRFDIARLGRFMLVFGPLSSVFDLITFAVLARMVSLSDPAGQAMFQAGWFAEALLTQLLVLLVLRGRRWIRPVPTMAATAGLATILAVALPLAGWGHTIGLLPPPPLFVAWLVVIVATYLAAAVAARAAFVHRTGSWL